MKVFILSHVHHIAEDEHGVVRHFDDDGGFNAAEDEGDNVKLLGVYSSRAEAEGRMMRAIEWPGFRDEPNCFWVDEYEVDRDEWPEGYVTV